MSKINCNYRMPALFLMGALATVACKQSLTGSNTEAAKAEKAQKEQKAPSGDVSYDVTESQIVVKFDPGYANDKMLKIFELTGNVDNVAMTNEDKTYSFSCPAKQCQMVVPLKWDNRQNGQTSRLFDLDGKIVLYWTGASAERLYGYLRKGITNYGNRDLPSSGTLTVNFGGVSVNGTMQSRFSMGCGMDNGRSSKDYSCEMFLNPDPKLLGENKSTSSASEGAIRGAILIGHDASYVYSRFRLAGDNFSTTTPSFNSNDLPAKNLSLVSLSCNAEGLARSCKVTIDTTYINYEDRLKKDKNAFKDTDFAKGAPPTKVYNPPETATDPKGTVKADLSENDSMLFFRAFGHAYNTYFMDKNSPDVKAMSAVVMFNTFDQNVGIDCGKTSQTSGKPVCSVIIRK